MGPQKEFSLSLKKSARYIVMIDFVLNIVLSDFRGDTWQEGYPYVASKNAGAK